MTEYTEYTTETLIRMIPTETGKVHLQMDFTDCEAEYDDRDDPIFVVNLKTDDITSYFDSKCDQYGFFDGDTSVYSIGNNFRTIVKMEVISPDTHCFYLEKVFLGRCNDDSFKYDMKQYDLTFTVIGTISKEIVDKLDCWKNAVNAKYAARDLPAFPREEMRISGEHPVAMPPPMWLEKLAGIKNVI